MGCCYIQYDTKITIFSNRLGVLLYFGIREKMGSKRPYAKRVDQFEN
jgi:hypothetical protein